MKEKELPVAKEINKEVPATTKKAKKLPEPINSENVVVIGGKKIEIKPTKLKYMRNRTAVFYRMLDVYPLADLLAFENDHFNDGRDMDEALMDFLIAATDNEELIRSCYDDIDAETIENIRVIFRRVNKIEEKEEALKNMEAKRKGEVSN